MTESTFDLSVLRVRALNAIVVFLWLLAGLVGIACWALQSPGSMPFVAALAVALVIQAMARMDPTSAQTRIVSGVAL